MEIQPRSFGDNLTAWFRLLARQWKPLIQVSLVTFVPAAFFTVLLFSATGANESFTTLMDPDLVDSLSPEEAFDLVVPFIWATAIWTLLLVIPTVFVYLAATRIVAADLKEESSGWSPPANYAWRRLTKAIVAGIGLSVTLIGALGVAALVGWWLIDSMDVGFASVFFTMVVALTALTIVLWVGLSCSLYSQAIGFEDIGAVESLTRSFQLIKGRWWITFGYFIVIGLIASVAAQVVSSVLFPLFLFGAATPWLFGVAYGVITLIQAPVAAAIAAGYALWYLDLWSRVETVTTAQLAEN